MNRHLINGGRIDLVRRNLGLTLEQYANMCEVPEKTMERICQGKNPPSGLTLLKLIRLGNVNPDILDIKGWNEEGV